MTPIIKRVPANLPLLPPVYLQTLLENCSLLQDSQIKGPWGSERPVSAVGKGLVQWTHPMYFPKASFVVPLPWHNMLNSFYLEISFNPIFNNLPHAGQHHLLHLLQPLFHHALWGSTNSGSQQLSIKARQRLWEDPRSLWKRLVQDKGITFLFKPVFLH